MGINYVGPPQKKSTVDYIAQGVGLAQTAASAANTAANASKSGAATDPMQRRLDNLSDPGVALPATGPTAPATATDIPSPTNQPYDSPMKRYLNRNYQGVS